MPKVIARVNDPRNQAHFDLLGISPTVCATSSIMALVEHEVPEHDMIHLLELRKENLEIVEVQIDRDSPSAGKRVEGLELPEGARLISVMRDGKAEIAVGVDDARARRPGAGDPRAGQGRRAPQSPAPPLGPVGQAFRGGGRPSSHGVEMHRRRARHRRAARRHGCERRSGQDGRRRPRLDALRLDDVADERADRPDGDHRRQRRHAACASRCSSTAPSTPRAIYLHGVQVGGAAHDVFFVTTTYGKTIAIDARRGAILWRFTPPGYARCAGSAQITTATPVADPDRACDLRRLAGREDPRSSPSPTGTPRGATAITRLPSREKVASSLNFDAGRVIATTGGYIGDAAAVPGSRRGDRRGERQAAARLELALLEPARAARPRLLPRRATPRSGAGPAR